MHGTESSSPANTIAESSTIMVTMESFGHRLETALNLSGMTIPELARVVGVDTSTVRKWAHDDRERAAVIADHLDLAATAMKVDLRWLLTGKGEPRPHQEGISFTAHQIAKQIDALPPEGQLAIATLVSALKGK